MLLLAVVLMSVLHDDDSCCVSAPGVGGTTPGKGDSHRIIICDRTTTYTSYNYVVEAVDYHQPTVFK